jgi:predicted phosphoribosyltransferase
MVDEFIALEIPRLYAGSVGAYYTRFPQLTDDEVMAILKNVQTVATHELVLI